MEDVESPAAKERALVRQQVAELIAGRIVVGHSLLADLMALNLSHPAELTRDTAFYSGLCPIRPRPLRQLVKERLGVDIQSEEHDSVEDARAVLALYKAVRKQWEASFTATAMAASLSSSSMTMTMMTTTTSSTAIAIAPLPFAAGAAAALMPAACI